MTPHREGPCDIKRGPGQSDIIGGTHSIKRVAASSQGRQTAKASLLHKAGEGNHSGVLEESELGRRAWGGALESTTPT